MIFLSETYRNRRVLSLRVGKPIGRVTHPIINPTNLKLEAWYAYDDDAPDLRILPALEVRDIIAKGIVVDDHDSITLLEDMVRLKEVLDQKYDLVNSTVQTQSGRTLGTVDDYAVEHTSFFVTKLYVKQGLLRSLLNLGKTQLIIDRTQIVDVQPDKIIVRDAFEKITEPAGATARA